MEGAAGGGPAADVDLERIEALLTEVKSQLDRGHRHVREALLEVQACGDVKRPPRPTHPTSACRLEPPSPTRSPTRSPRSPCPRVPEGKRMQLADFKPADFNSEANAANVASSRDSGDLWRSASSECHSPLPMGTDQHRSADLHARANPSRARERREWRQQSPEADQSAASQGSDQGSDLGSGIVLPATCSSRSVIRGGRLPGSLPSWGRASRRTASSASMGSATSWFSARSWWQNLSLRPRQSRGGATSAMEMVEHDSVRSYDLRSLFGGMMKLGTESQNVAGSIRLSWNLKRWATAADDRPSQLRRNAQELVQRPGYEMCVMLLIVANSLFLGCQVQHEALYRAPLRWNLEVEAFFCIAFTLELLMKFYAGRRHFLFGSEASWNWFDVLVVVLMLFDLIVSLTVDDTSGVWAQASGLRILRVLRVIRFLRSVRQLKFFSQLRIMIQSIMFSFRPLLWASIVLLGMFFVFGVCLTQGVVDYLQINSSWEEDSSAELRTYFGTLERSMLSLFKAMSGGINWGELLDALSLLQVHFQCVFLFFVLFAVFGAANVVTGIFVEIANHWAHHDSHTQVQAESEQKLFCIKALMELFHELDPCGHGTVTLERMLDAFRDDDARVVNSFHALHLEVMDVRTLFLLLDRDRKGFISTEEFLLGCFRLKGEAKTLDVMKLQYQSEWIMHNLVLIAEKLDDLRVRPMDPAESDAMPRDETCMFRNLSAQVSSQQWQKLFNRSLQSSEAAGGSFSPRDSPTAAAIPGSRICGGGRGRAPESANSLDL